MMISLQEKRLRPSG